MTSASPLESFVPSAFRTLADPARSLPRLAKDPSAVEQIEAALRGVPTKHEVVLGDARIVELPKRSVHLVLTSPPYWTLKEYRRCDGQLGWIEDYEQFLDELDAVWRMCHSALVPGGRLVCVVGDVACRDERTVAATRSSHCMLRYRSAAERLGSTTWRRSYGQRSQTLHTRWTAEPEDSSGSRMNPTQLSRTTSSSSLCKENRAGIGNPV